MSDSESEVTFEVNPLHIYVIHNGIRLQVYLQPDLDYLEIFEKRIEYRGGIIIKDIIDADFVIVMPPPPGKFEMGGNEYQRCINLASKYGKITVNFLWPIDSIEQNKLLPWHEYCEWAPGVINLKNMDWNEWGCKLVERRVNANKITFRPGVIECLKMMPHIQFESFHRVAKWYWKRKLHQNSDPTERPMLKPQRHQDELMTTNTTTLLPIPSQTLDYQLEAGSHPIHSSPKVRTFAKWTQGEVDHLMGCAMKLEDSSQLFTHQFARHISQTGPGKRTCNAVRGYIYSHREEIRREFVRRLGREQVLNSDSNQSDAPSPTPKSVRQGVCNSRVSRNRFWSQREKDLVWNCLQEVVQASNGVMKMTQAKQAVKIKLTKQLGRGPTAIAGFFQSNSSKLSAVYIEALRNTQSQFIGNQSSPKSSSCSIDALEEHDSPGSSSRSFAGTISSQTVTSDDQSMDFPENSHSQGGLHWSMAEKNQLWECVEEAFERFSNPDSKGVTKYLSETMPRRIQHSSKSVENLLCRQKDEFSRQMRKCLLAKKSTDLQLVMRSPSIPYLGQPSQSIGHSEPLFEEEEEPSQLQGIQAPLFQGKGGSTPGETPKSSEAVDLGPEFPEASCDVEHESSLGTLSPSPSLSTVSRQLGSIKFPPSRPSTKVLPISMTPFKQRNHNLIYTRSQCPSPSSEHKGEPRAISHLHAKGQIPGRLGQESIEGDGNSGSFREHFAQDKELYPERLVTYESSSDSHGVETTFGILFDEDGDELNIVSSHRRKRRLAFVT